MKRHIEKIYTMKMDEKEFDLIASSLKRSLEESYVSLLRLEGAPLHHRRESKMKILQRELFDSLQAYETFTGEKHNIHSEEVKIKKELGINANETTSTSNANETTSNAKTN
ncbi:MAG: hypothetical protein RR358_05985 [Cetobacterium sp.]